MDAPDRATVTAAAVSEAMNTLALFVCPHAWRALPEDVERTRLFRRAVEHLSLWPNHASNVAEDVVYLVEGTIIRHRN